MLKHLELINGWVNEFLSSKAVTFPIEPLAVKHHNYTSEEIF